MSDPQMSSAGTLSTPLAASPWERELFEHLTNHIQTERALLDEYVAAAADSRSKALSYLVDLIVQDEVRHHTLFRELAKSLKATAEFRHENGGVPVLDFGRDTREDVLRATELLLRRERADRKELKALRRHLRQVKETTLWDLLVDIMLRDTEKHIAILRFAKRHALQATR